MKKKEKPSIQKEEITLISLRVPTPLLDKIKEKGQKENRTLSNMIVTALKELFK